MRIALTKENQRPLREHLKQIANVRLRDKKQELNYVEDDIQRASGNLRIYLEKRKRISDEIIKEEANVDNVADSLMNVTALDKVKEAYYDTDNKYIIVTTNPLYFRTLNGGRYYLGNATIKYGTANFNIIFDSNNRRRSYWGSSCPHPHVSESGGACLGNTAELIASLQAEKEYGLLFEILIAFLEQANTDDCAGRHAMNWDKVDEAGQVIQEGFMDRNGENFKYGRTPDDDRVVDGRICACCGEEIDDDDDEVRTINGEEICGECVEERYRYCDICNEWHDADDVSYYEELGRYVCNDCLNEDYRVCDVCGKYHHVDYSNYVDSTEQSVCEHCLETKFSYCDVCEEYHPSDETIYVESTSDVVCNNCLNKYYELCASCNEYFLKEDMKHDGANGAWLCTDCYEDEADDETEDDEEDEVAVSDDEDDDDELPFAPELVLPQHTRCDVCGNVIDVEESVVFGDETYCISCAVDKF